MVVSTKLDFDLDDLVTGNPDDPSNIDTIYYLFWEKGIDYNRFKDLPLPYIFKILKVHSWIKEKERQEYEKAKRKK